MLSLSEKILNFLIKYNIYAFVIAICVIIVSLIAFKAINQNTYDQYLLIEKESYIIKRDRDLYYMKKVFCRTNEQFLKCNPNDTMAIFLHSLFCDK